MNLDQFIGDGKTHRIPLIWEDAPYSPPEGSVLIWTAKRSDADLDPAALVQKISGVNLTVSGTDAFVTLVHADTVAMATKIAAVWDIQCQAPGESPKTLNSGMIAFRRDVTRALTTSIPIFTVNPPAVVGGDYVSAAVAVETSNREVADLSLADYIALRVQTDLTGMVEAVAEAVAEADQSLASVISDEASARSIADTSLATAITAEASTRSTADVSIATAVAAEASTRTAQDALKLDKSGGTMTGLLTANGGISTTTITTSGAVTSAGAVTSGGSSSVGAFVVDGPSGSYRTFAFKTAGFTSQKLQLNAAGNFEAQDYDDAGAWIRSWLIHNRLDGTTTISGAITAATITNYATAVTTAALLALTPAQSAAKRLAYVGDCYNLSGTLTGGLAHWLGDATAGTWVLSDCGVAVTRDTYTFLASLAARGINLPELSSGTRRLRAYQRFRHGLVNSAWATVGTGAYISFSNAAALNRSRHALNTGATTTGSCIASVQATESLYLAESMLQGAHVSTIQLSAASDATDTFRAWSGFVGADQISPRSGAYAQACFVYDPQDTLTLGVKNGNWWTLTSTTGGLSTLKDTGISATSTLRHLLVYVGASSVQFYVDGVLATTHDTNHPSGVVSPSEGIAKTAGTTNRVLYVSDAYVSSIATS